MSLPEKIFFNGNILTQDKNNPIVSAFAVADGKIIATGNDDEILQLQTPHTKLETLNNRTVLPAFNDAHIHIWKVGNLMTYLLDLRGVRSIEEMQQRLSDYAKQNPGLDWIQSRGFNEVFFAEGRMPNRFDIDKVINDRPVIVMRTCAHQIIVNTKALQRAGITKETQPLSGGEIKFLPDGELAGHFTETALGLVMDKIPAYSSEQYRKMILAAQDELLRFGITSATDPAVIPDLMEVYRSMDKNGELKIRMNVIPIRLPDGASHALPLPEQHASDHLKINTVKFFSDGGLSGKTAALNRSYKNSTSKGVLRLEKNFFVQLAGEAREAGFRIATHAIGDAAIDLVLDVYEEILKRGTFSPAGSSGAVSGFRIEHLGLPSEENLIKMKAINVSAVMQPIFIFELGENFRNYLDDDYLHYVYPSRSVLDHQINLSFSTDAPVVKNFDPMMGIQAAVERKDAAGFRIAEKEKISADQAIFAYTMGSALAQGDENLIGSISPGKWADFIVINKNPLTVPSSELSSCRVLATYSSANCLYRSEGFKE